MLIIETNLYLSQYKKIFPRDLREDQFFIINNLA